MIKRRGFLAGLTGLLCAPALVRASSLMPISVLPAVTSHEWATRAIAYDLSLYPPEPFTITAILNGYESVLDSGARLYGFLGAKVGDTIWLEPPPSSRDQDT